ncbi:MAG: GNAT family N-acetyltransferase [Robiginitomaculum sp.]|nr:MAG: GNAT family N-acetyltransferase [Robiginitomaculum sp.]
MRIRPFIPSDISDMLLIYNEVIANSTAIYIDTPSTLEELQNWVKTKQAQNYPVLVAVDGDTVLGFSAFGDWRPKPGYRYTVEHTVHVSADTRGQGIGAQLVKALFPYAHALGKHVILGVVDGENTGSIRFHERLGFKEVARFPQVGYKFDRWLDAVFMQRFIDEKDAG